MADSAKLRLVRCPKCENLLPELPGYSVYQCGGCGAVLRAKKSENEGSRVQERSVEARGVISEKSDILSAKSEDIPGKSAACVVKNDSDGSSGVEAESHGNGSKGPVEKLPVEIANMGKVELSNGGLESSAELSNSDVQSANANGFAKQKGMERVGESDGFGRSQRNGSEVVGFHSLMSAGEGTSRYNGNGANVHRSAVLMENQREVGNSNGAEDVGPSREELLRKLDELKEQLSKACDVNEKHKEKDPVVARMFGESDNWYPDHSSGFSRNSRQLYTSDEHGTGQNYCDRYHEPYGAQLRRPRMLNDYYHSSTQDLSHVPGYDTPFGSRLYSRQLPRQTSCLNSQQQRSLPHMPGHFLGTEPDLFEPHPYSNPALKHFSCSCYQCHLKHSMQFPPTTNYRRHPFVPQGCDSRIGHNPHIGSYDPQAHTRWPSDVNGFASSHPHRVLVANNDGRRCRPMAGGAPFVTCHNCFELLELPKTAPNIDKSRWKIRCGGCSSLISFAMVEEKLVPVDAPPKQTLKDVFDNSDEVILDRPYDPHGGMRRDNMGFHSEEDYDNSGYDFRSMEKEPNSSSDRHDFNSSKSEELRNNTHLLSSSTSEDEVFAGNEMAMKAESFPPPPGSPLQEHFDHSTKFRAVNRCGKGNLSSRSDQERVLPCKNTVRQNSLKESLATEMDLSLNEYANTGIPHDTADTSGEEDLPKHKKGVDSFFAGIIKKSFRDFSKSSQTAENGKRSVFINGRLMPDRSVKRAEKIAGPAGFWGVMGGPCLGIIPPNIEEFSYPMPQNCANGNTGVIVNGRELHLNDLDLLASRGLPVTTNRSYIIDISGKVIDEDTGEELDCLGKLAPTIEKVKHGFGMRAPKTISFIIKLIT
ncbi:hypothetical protein V2J09_004442 [Rumex salicifolius]